MAEDHGHQASFVEAPEKRPLADLLYPKLHRVLRKLSLSEQAKASAYEAMRALRGFASVFEVSVGDVSLSVDPERGTADSGDLESDLGDLFDRVGEAAKAAASGWTLLIDEVQYLTGRELAALIVAIHRVNQNQLPVIFFGAGLPQVAGLSGDAKSYAERLFSYPSIGPLDEVAARDAIVEPIRAERETIRPAAVELIVERTHGYPYFLQEWGYQAWNASDASPIDVADVEVASDRALERLDQGFFQVRFDRLTPKERDYVIAMARLGKGPYRSGDVADQMGENTKALGPTRHHIIQKGMIYSPAHGDIDFTVPLFDEYLERTALRI